METLLSKRRRPKYDYAAHSQIAGKLTAPPKGGYKLRYRPIMNRREFLTALFLVTLNLALEIFFLFWLFRAENFTWSDDPNVFWLTVTIVAFIAVIEGFRLVNIFTLCLAALLARDPVPVKPEKNLRVAFTTTIVPSKEPFDVLKKTLKKMKQVRHKGTLDVWLLDEGNEDYIKQACAEMGVKHFSRKGIDKWNTKKGQFKTKSKHGNHNSWLDAHGDQYDVVVSVDPDHVPLKNFCERLLGYFRDPDVAFVVGPQVYGNVEGNFVTRGAESQAYLFQAAIQRAGNAYNAAMFVGTNHAYRVKTWQQIGGFQDSITEDMLTSIQVHSHKNPATGKYWKSVYTPDVLAVGEGPTSWTDFFSQQLRWSRGSNEILVKNYWKTAYKLTAGKRLHYSLLMAFYPSVAIGWALGIILSMLFLTFGLIGVHIPGAVWLALYTDAALASAGMYMWLRRYNVSPHEEKQSPGILGMFMSMVAAPIYFTALSGALLRRKLNFVVTPKGDSASPDRLRTFSKQFKWAFVAMMSLVMSVVFNQHYFGVWIWPVLTVATCMAPVFIWLRTQERRPRRAYRRQFMHSLHPRNLIKLKGAA